VFAADFLTHSAPPGAPPTREGLKQTNLAIRAALPDIQSAVEDVIAEGDEVVWHWSARGTHRAPLLGLPATGKQITITGITIDRIAGGQIAERWDQVDMLGLMQQLGAIPAPGQAPT
jgi:steroid delta-isomerase-like uncharacterized protein